MTIFKELQGGVFLQDSESMIDDQKTWHDCADEGEEGECTHDTCVCGKYLDFTACPLWITTDNGVTIGVYTEQEAIDFIK